MCTGRGTPLTMRTAARGALLGHSWVVLSRLAETLGQVYLQIHFYDQNLFSELSSCCERASKSTLLLHYLSHCLLELALRCSEQGALCSYCWCRSVVWNCPAHCSQDSLPQCAGGGVWNIRLYRVLQETQKCTTQTRTRPSTIPKLGPVPM